MSLRRAMLHVAVAGFMLFVPLSVGYPKEPGTKVRADPRAFEDDASNARSTPSAGGGFGEKSRVPAMEPKALSASVKRGLGWLIEHQLPNGAWGQGEEAEGMRASMGDFKDKGNVADSCMATLALMRAGSTPRSGPHSKAVRNGIEFVIGEIEASDRESLYVTSARGTRVQGKIGPFVDTFMSSLLLAEARGTMVDEPAERRLTAALNKVLTKIEKNQRQDGTWDGRGWAPVLSQAIAAKGLNRAAQAGVSVDRDVLSRTQGHAEGQFDRKTGTFKGEGSAGVPLYSAGASLGSMADAVNTNDMEEEQVRDLAKNAKDPGVRKAAEKRLESHRRAEAARDAAEASVVAGLRDPSFVSGFGSNGGEEFLSYMLVSESLVVKGGREWEEWDRSMAENLGRVQNGDGSWTGHHCITGRTFVTSAALLVLTADRAPVPLASKLRQG